ncbi:hypothetical protein BJ546DRAFT_155482 [Cryomyces antarcticus]
MVEEPLPYDAITSFFQSHEGEVVEIEILPSAMRTSSLVLRDGACIGIPKKVLVRAFLTARVIFTERGLFTGTESTDHYLNATRVILLLDPEHLTAANYRKKYLRNLRESCGDSAGEVVFAQAVFRELCFLTSILTSPLHRQTKSPTLWSHRHWIVRNFCDHFLPVHRLKLDTPSLSAPQNPWQLFSLSELEVVFKSGERHPKNYYAWQYARRLIETGKQNGATRRSTTPESVATAMRLVHDWCIRHPSDTSGWSFLSFLLTQPENTEELTYRLMGETLSLAFGLQWRHDSLWVFVRTMLTDHRCALSLPHLGDLISRLRDYVKIKRKQGDGAQNVSPDSEQRKSGFLAPSADPVQDALQWIENNQTFVSNRASE